MTIIKWTASWGMEIREAMFGVHVWLSRTTVAHIASPLSVAFLPTWLAADNTALSLSFFTYLTMWVLPMNLAFKSKEGLPLFTFRWGSSGSITEFAFAFSWSTRRCLNFFSDTGLAAGSLVCTRWMHWLTWPPSPSGKPFSTICAFSFWRCHGRRPFDPCGHNLPWICC